MSMLTGLKNLPRAVFTAPGAEMRRLWMAETAIRVPISTSRRISVVSLRGGSGCSSVAAALATIYATRRAGRLLAVSADSNRSGLGAALGVRTEEWISPVSKRRDTPESLEDATHHLHTWERMTYLGVEGAGQGRQAAPQDWVDHVAPVSRFFGVVVTDFGARDWRTDLGDIAASGQTTVLVSNGVRANVEDAARFLPALNQGDSRAVLAVVDVTGTRPHPLLPHLSVPAVPVHHVGYEPVAAAGGMDRLSFKNRAAYLRLASSVMRQATRTTDDSEGPVWS